MRNLAAMMILVAAVSLSACVSGKPKSDVYTGSDGTQTRIETDRESCERSCNADRDRCGDTFAARSTSSPLDAPRGADAGCNSSLASCMKACKSR